MNTKQEFLRKQELEVAHKEPDAVMLPMSLTPAQLIQVAVQRGETIEYVRELMQLEREWKADKAREAYVSAMAEFKAEPMAIKKDKRVSYTTNRGPTSYNHASLAEVVDAVVAGLGKHGLSHRWDTRQENGIITVSCIITHKLGHSESTTLFSAPDDSGGKNSIQAVGSTVTYLQRYTLMAATGVAARDMDNDGRSAGETINAQQAADLEALITEVAADKAAFLKYIKAEKLEDIPAKSYESCVKMLEAKRKQKKSAQ